MGPIAAEATEGCFMAEDIKLGWDMRTLLITLDACVDPGGGAANCLPNWLVELDPNMSPVVEPLLPADRLDPALGGIIRDWPPIPVGGYGYS